MTDYGMPPVSDAEIKECCGNDDGSDFYKNCVADLEKTGNCHMNQTVYGPPPVDEKALKECCGDDDGSEEYNACVQNYKEFGGCVMIEEPTPSVYGPPPSQE